MWRSGVFAGFVLALLGLAWLRRESADVVASATTFPLHDAHPHTTHRTTQALLHQIEATAPWILKVNEKSSTKS
ncbi:MAG: hypothetical protein RLY87_299 [Chloroflexota bacterium]|jgi:hypothetical protein